MNTAEATLFKPTLAMAAGAVLLWLFAIMAATGHVPAVQRATSQVDLIIKNLSLDEPMPAPGDTVTVKAAVFNPNRLEGIFPVMLEVGGKIARTIYVSLSGNADQVVEFTVTAGPVGTYLVKVGPRGQVMLVTDPR